VADGLFAELDFTMEDPRDDCADEKIKCFTVEDITSDFMV
jgi:hypothetical protein